MLPCPKLCYGYTCDVKIVLRSCDGKKKTSYWYKTIAGHLTDTILMFHFILFKLVFLNVKECIIFLTAGNQSETTIIKITKVVQSKYVFNYRVNKRNKKDGAHLSNRSYFHLKKRLSGSHKFNACKFLSSARTFCNCTHKSGSWQQISKHAIL